LALYLTNSCKMLKSLIAIAAVIATSELCQSYYLTPAVRQRSFNLNANPSDREIDLGEASKINFEVPVRSVTSQKSMISRGVGMVGALITSGLLSSSRVGADDYCAKCGTVGCESTLCKVGNAPDAWYNPENERIFDTYHKSYLPAKPELYLSQERLEGKKIITIGETHTNPLCHRLELDVIRALALNNVGNDQNMAIGLECFFRQHQGALDRFVFIHHDLATLKRETDWDKSWGYDLNFYAKIFNFASMHGIRLVGLNVPYQVAQLVGEVGLADMPPKLKKLLPEIDLGVSKHREQFEAAIGSFGGHGAMKPEAFTRMYEVQTLWDEYMAESAAIYATKYPNDLLVVIAGVGHVAGRVGIPDRISRRTKAETFVIVPQPVDWIASSGLPDVNLPLTADDCDWAWYTERELSA
jgi:uncharacterized iron-regulated protein